MATTSADRLGKISGIALGMALLAVVVSAAYSFSSPAEEAAASADPHADVAQMQAPADVETTIANLALRLESNPSDLDGWRMLGWSYAQTGRPDEAIGAYRKALGLAPRSAGLWSALGEAQRESQIHRGDAPQSFDRALALDPAEPRARYFKALIKAEAGDRKGAVEDWLALLRDSPADAEWAPDVRQAALRTAEEAGMDISGRLPAGQSIAEPMPGPTAAQMASAQALPEAEQQQMIAGMVDRLAARLADNPRDAEGWIRLMRARMVLGQPQAATRAFRSGLAAFDGEADTQARLRAAAAELLVPTG